MDTNGLIDDRNFELWNSLCAIYDIEIRKETRPDYLIFTKSDKAIIFVPIDNLDTASFTHELLHIYLKTKQVFIGSGLAISIKESQKLSTIFSDDLLDHIGNCLDHIKMLPLFLELGYQKSDFISDYTVNKLTKDEILLIKTHYISSIFPRKVFNASAVDFFIGKYFAANACSNNSYDYLNQLLKLKQIDPDLFEILEKFLLQWKNFDYNNEDPITGGYNLFLLEFIDNLEKWTDGKIIK